MVVPARTSLKTSTQRPHLQWHPKISLHLGSDYRLTLTKMSTRNTHKRGGNSIKDTASIGAAGDEDEDVSATGDAKRRKTDTAPTLTTAAAGLDHTSYAAPSLDAAANANAHEFNHFLFKIIAFKAERGNYQISKEEFPELHNWMQSLKREYKHHTMDPATCSLTEEQLKVLEFLHIPVTSRGDDHWNRFYGKYDERASMEQQ